VLGTTLSAVAAPTTTIQVVVSPVDASGITTIGYCFTNSSAISGTVTTSATISGPGYSGTQNISSGAFLAYLGMPSCPNMVGSASGLRLAAGSTFSTSVTAVANGITYVGSTSFSTAAAPADTQPPSLVAGSASLTSPSITGQVVSIPVIGNVSDGMSTNSDFTVAINISDNTGVSNVNFWVDSSGDPARLGAQIPGTSSSGSLISGTAQNGRWSYSGHFPSAASLSGGCGRYTVRVTAVDAAGNSTGTQAAREIDIVTCTS
jgi:hypothetical protein